MCSLLICYICVTFLGRVRNSHGFNYFVRNNQGAPVFELIVCEFWKNNVKRNHVISKFFWTIRPAPSMPGLSNYTRIALRRSITTCAIDPNDTYKKWSDENETQMSKTKLACECVCVGYASKPCLTYAWR